MSPSRGAPTILFVSPEDWYFWHHRRDLAHALVARGWGVLVVTRVAEHGQRMVDAGFRVIPMRMDRASRNILAEIAGVRELASIYREERPDVVHHVTIKPVLYGTVAAWMAGVKCVVNTVAGLGYLFVAENWRARVLRGIVVRCYSIAMRLNRRGTRVISENPEDLASLVGRGMVQREQGVLIRGVGVNPSEYPMSPEPLGVPVVMMAGRLLWNKGVRELVEAVAAVRSRGIVCRLVIVGTPDTSNPRAVPRAVLQGWHDSGAAEWWGARNDMAAVLAQANVVALPSSYGEGIPRVLLEGASVGRALIATDVPGCREIVIAGVTGLLVPPRDPGALEDALALLLSRPDLRARLGAEGRRTIERDFATEHVIRATEGVYAELLADAAIAR
jgi:glycosyltransferase involved in cell wall biosynthesis